MVFSWMILLIVQHWYCCKVLFPPTLMVKCSTAYSRLVNYATLNNFCGCYCQANSHPTQSSPPACIPAMYWPNARMFLYSSTPLWAWTSLKRENQGQSWNLWMAYRVIIIPVNVWYTIRPVTSISTTHPYHREWFTHLQCNCVTGSLPDGWIGMILHKIPGQGWSYLGQQ